MLTHKLHRAFIQAQNVYLQTISGIFSSSTSGLGTQDPAAIILAGDLPDVTPSVPLPAATVVPAPAQSNGIATKSTAVDTKAPPAATINGTAKKSIPVVAKANVVKDVAKPNAAKISEATLPPKSKIVLPTSKVSALQVPSLSSHPPHSWGTTI
jgi:hypothetical protein